MAKRIHPAKVLRSVRTKPKPGSPQAKKARHQKELVEKVRRQSGKTK